MNEVRSIFFDWINCDKPRYITTSPMEHITTALLENFHRPRFHSSRPSYIHTKAPSEFGGEAGGSFRQPQVVGFSFHCLTRSDLRAFPLPYSSYKTCGSRLDSQVHPHQRIIHPLLPSASSRESPEESLLIEHCRLMYGKHIPALQDNFQP